MIFSYSKWKRFQKGKLQRDKEQAAHQEKGEKIYAAALAGSGVGGLSALPDRFRSFPVPKDSQEVC